MSEIKGPDLASFQHPNNQEIDFAAAKAAGYEFVIVKASEGNFYRNPWLRTTEHRLGDVERAKAAGFKVGVYHFLRANVDAVAQANFFLESIKGLTPFNLPLAIDVETMDNEPASMVHYRLDQFRTVLRQHGYRTMTYSYTGFLEAVCGDCKFCASDPLWLADYQPAKPPAPKPWGEIAIWQYTDHEMFGGVGADMSVFVGSDWAAFVGERAPAPARGLPGWYHRLLEFPISKLHNAGEVKGGMQAGADVAAVQRKLGIKADGYFGPITSAHVKGFQKAHRLAVDGIVGPDTARALGE